jgi:hypothetical protein
VALGDENGVPVAKVAERLGAAAADVAAALESLSELALAWTHAGRIHLPVVMRGNGYGRFGLGQPVAPVLSRLTVAQLKDLGEHLGLRTGQRKQQVVDNLLAFFRDGERVRKLVADSPAGVAELLEDFAWRGPELDCDLGWHGYHSYRRTARPETPAAWALRHGLLLATSEGDAHMPLEVGLALRGPGYRLPFEPRPPVVAVAAVAPEQVDAETSAAALRLLDRLTTVVDTATAEPIPLLKSGGVGARVIKKLAKETGATPEEIRLAVELAVTTELLTVEEPPEPPAKGRRSRRPEPTPPANLVPTEDFTRWRRAAPATQLQLLLSAWWTLPFAPLGDEKAIRAVLDDGPSDVFTDIRQLTVRVLTELDAGIGVVERTELTELVAWHAPSIDAGILSLLVASSLAEATLVGVVAANAAGGVAHALVGAEPEMMVKATQQLVAGACATALFGTDLTAIVTGPPGTELAALLDTVADRETQGSASTWRFSPHSVRRAFDSGETAADLIGKLGSVARGELPQSLTYLLNDVARRHGEVGVIDVKSVVVGENPALLIEIAAHRKLVKLGLNAVAPSVLTSTADAATTLAALRDAGYAPVQRSSDGSIVVRNAKPAVVAPPHDDDEFDLTFDEPLIAAQDPLEHAERLLKAPATPLRRLQRGALMNVLLGEHRGEAWMRIIWQLEVGYPAWVSYHESDGKEGKLLISHPELDGDQLDVWCADPPGYRRLDVSRIGPS